MKHYLREVILLTLNDKNIIVEVDSITLAQFLNRVLKQYVILTDRINAEVTDACPVDMRRNPKEFYQFNENTQRLIQQEWTAYLTEHERPKYWFDIQKLKTLITSIVAHKTVSPEIDYFVVIGNQVKLMTAT